mmetsp:Transcript_53701/g.138844  ORF Transcript_53701/g.138844 Transcript_53701/m.138844 type:complete len:123 (-) Transcript_53701:285-653(-)
MPPSKRLVDSFKAASYRRSLNSTEGGSAHFTARRGRGRPDRARTMAAGRHGLWNHLRIWRPRRACGGCIKLAASSSVASTSGTWHSSVYSLPCSRAPQGSALTRLSSDSAIWWAAGGAAGGV